MVLTPSLSSSDLSKERRVALLVRDRLKNIEYNFHIFSWSTVYEIKTLIENKYNIKIENQRIYLR